MTNKWVEFVKKWAAKHNQTYMCAATKTKCREAYHRANPKSKTQKKTRSNAVTKKAHRNKKKAQRELLQKYKAYAEHKKAKGVRLE
jgi:hypothetical protein